MPETVIAETRKRDRNSDDTRASILDAVRQLIVETGNVTFSLARVAQVSGKNAALVSYHFGGKDQMLLALLKDDESPLMSPVEKLIARTDITAEEKLKLHIRGLIKLHSKKPYLSILMRTLVRRSDGSNAQQLVEQQAQPLIRLQAAILEQGERENLFRKVDPFAFYMTMIGSMEFFFAATATIKFGFGYDYSDSELQERFANSFMDFALRMVLKDVSHLASETAPVK